MKNYLVLYTPGMCGSWLTWLINQHKNFPRYFMNHKKYVNDMGQSTILDVGCDGADWYIYNHDTIPQHVDAGDREHDNWTIWLEYQKYMTEKNARSWPRLGKNKVNKEIADFDFKDNRIVRNKQVRNKSFTKDCVKPLPNHGLFKKGNDTIVDEVLLKKALDDIGPTTKIIVPYFNSSNLTIVKRWAIYRDYHGTPLKDAPQDELDSWVTLWKEHFEYLQENPYGENVHYVDIEKLTSSDNNEYLKLCEAIGEEPMDNIQTLISQYRLNLVNVAAHFDRKNNN
mgnify:CR=1 FL=1